MVCKGARHCEFVFLVTVRTKESSLVQNKFGTAHTILFGYSSFHAVLEFRDQVCLDFREKVTSTLISSSPK